MKLQVNTDKNVEGSETLSKWIEADPESALEVPGPGDASRSSLNAVRNVLTRREAIYQLAADAFDPAVLDDALELVSSAIGDENEWTTWRAAADTDDSTTRGCSSRKPSRFVFFDGGHHRDPALRFFRRLREHVNEKNILVVSLPQGTAVSGAGCARTQTQSPHSTRTRSGADRTRGRDRMSPQGISLFYASADAATAVAEIAGHGVAPLAIGGRFVTTRDLTVLAGDAAAAARKRLQGLLRERDKLGSGSFDMEPFEALRHIIRDEPHRTFGGPPQVAKVYRFARPQPFGVVWPDPRGRVAALGCEGLHDESVSAPTIDPDRPLVGDGESGLGVGLGRRHGAFPGVLVVDPPRPSQLTRCVRPAAGASW